MLIIGQTPVPIDHAIVARLGSGGNCLLNRGGCWVSITFKNKIFGVSMALGVLCGDGRQRVWTLATVPKKETLPYVKFLPFCFLLLGVLI